MKIELPFKSAPESICILRLSAIGDVCNVVPIVRTLHSYWPTTKISWIIGSLEHQLVDDISGVEFIVCNKKNGFGELIDLEKENGRTSVFDFITNASGDADQFDRTEYPC